MLHYRHELYGVVSERLDARKDIFRKFKVSANSVFLGRHTYMALIYKGRFFGLEIRVSPGETSHSVI